MKKKYLVSVIIPTLNEEDYLPHLLNDIKAQTIEVHEIIVVDAHSQDNTRKIAFRNKTLVINHFPHVGLQRNFGARYSTGNYLLFLDADVRLHEKFIEESIQEFKRRNLGIACPTFSSQSTHLLSSLFFSFFSKLFKFSENHLPSGAGMCILIQKSIFDKHKGFSRLKRYEDIELIRRVSTSDKYGVLQSKLFVSDRRFKEYGHIKTIGKYLLLSLFFTLGLFSLANKISYPMGKYSKKS